MNDFQWNYIMTVDCSLLFCKFIIKMPPEILSVYTKVWTTGFSVTFLHDSASCNHCLNNKVNIVRKVKTNGTNNKSECPGKEENPHSSFDKADWKPLVVKHDCIPESSFLPLGIQLTDSVLVKLGLKSSRKLKKCEKISSQNLSTQKNVKSNCELSDSYDKHKNSFKSKRKKSSIKNNISERKVLSKYKNKDHKFRSVHKKSSVTKEPLNKKPNKGTLKRKRWTMEKLKQYNNNYEDDIFEAENQMNYKQLVEDDSDSKNYESMVTPNIRCLSPNPVKSRSPSYDSSFSPSELETKRKEAEEYIFRREKRRKSELQNKKNEREVSVIKNKNSTDYTTETLKETCRILKKAMLKAVSSESDDDKDSYFSDTSNDSDMF